MKSNPEFIRNLWLELTPHNLIALPLVFGLMLLLHLVTNDYHLDRDTGHAAVMLLLLFTGIWGTRKTSGAVYGEVVEHTWDWQRMSGLSPWAMTWGKVFGSSSFAWYGGLLCLMVAVLGYANGHAPVKDWQLLGLALLGVLLSQGLGFLVNLLYVRSRSLENARGGGSIYLLVLLLFLFLSSYVVDIRHAKILDWYGHSLNALNYLLLTGLLMWLWTLIGSYRVMRRELSYSTSPWVWLAFLGFLPLFFGGLVEEQGAMVWLLLTFCFWVVAAWIGLFVESKNPVDLRALFMAIKAGQGRRVAQLMPAWMSAFLLLPPVLLLLYGLSAPVGEWSSKITIGLPHLATSVFFFLLRDICIFLLLALSAKSRRADFTAVLYILVLYLLIPWLLGNLGLDQLRVFFQPSLKQSGIWAVGGALTAAVIALVLVIRRWQQWSSRQTKAA